mmetsp:Transcript_78779/g.234772  ORF Transcript_78779/g.234772 Transcript_78779/m.234772 type:complete len:297 (+) Transcript_78779:391-1281(+)
MTASFLTPFISFTQHKRAILSASRTLPPAAAWVVWKGNLWPPRPSMWKLTTGAVCDIWARHSNQASLSSGTSMPGRWPARISSRNFSASFFGIPLRILLKHMAATRAATICLLLTALSGTAKWTFLSSRGMSNSTHFFAGLSSTKFSGSSAVLLSSSPPRIVSSSGKPYFKRAIECLNWRYSQSWTCSVHAVMECCRVLAWAQTRGTDLNFLQMMRSASFRAAQKQSAWVPVAVFTNCSRLFKSFTLLPEPPPESRQRMGGAAPMPTSHCFSRNCSWGYARSMQTVSIFAHVSPQP